MKKTVKLFKVSPILAEGVIRVRKEVISKEVDFSNEENQMLDFFYENIGCDLIDVVVFGDYYSPSHFTATVDDEGLLKSNNVVLNYKINVDGRELAYDLCGTVLFGRVGEVEGREEDGFFELGLNDEDIEYLDKNLQIDLVGVTN